MWNRISALVVLVVLFGCNREEEPGPGNPTGTEYSYPIYDIQEIEVGKFVVKQLDNSFFEIGIELTTAFPSTTEIIIMSDNSIDGNSEIATIGLIDAGTTTVSYDKPIGFDRKYNQMLEFDGHIAFKESNSRIAYSDIGGNEILNDSEEYELLEADIPGSSGSVVFQKRKNEETIVTVQVVNSTPGVLHPMHIHNNTLNQGGGVAIPLTFVNGSTGFSITNVDAVTYDELTNFNGYIFVHNSEPDFNTIIAAGDIGGNVFTGNETEYEARSTSVHNVSGTVTLKERKNTNTLVIVELINDIPGVNHVAHIHNGTAAEGGTIDVNLESFNGLGKTDLQIPYSDLISYDGYVNVHYSSNDMSTFVAQADIGLNAFTGEKIEYTLNEVDNSGISGMATFEERLSGETLIALRLTGTDQAQDYANHIHQNSASAGGGIIINLNQINGATGEAFTNIAQRNNGSAITYSELLTINAHIAIHEPPGAPPTYVSLGDIGSN